MLVFTQPGQRTDAWTFPPVAIASSWWRHSVIATTACFVAQYGDIPGGVSSPAIEASRPDFARSSSM